MLSGSCEEAGLLCLLVRLATLLHWQTIVVCHDRAGRIHTEGLHLNGDNGDRSSRNLSGSYRANLDHRDEVCECNGVRDSDCRSHHCGSGEHRICILHWRLARGSSIGVHNDALAMCMHGGLPAHVVCRCYYLRCSVDELFQAL